MTSFPSPERVSLARSTGRSVVRSQTAGRSSIRNRTRSHPHIQAGIGSQSSPLQFPIRCGGPTVLSDLLPGRHGKLAGDLRYYSHLRGHRPFLRQGTSRVLNSCGYNRRPSHDAPVKPRKQSARHISKQFRLIQSKEEGK